VSDAVERVKRLAGVQYVCEYSGHFRVVFKHHADSTTIHEAERLMGCGGRIGATQEHMAFVEYPIDEVENADAGGDSA